MTAHYLNIVEKHQAGGGFIGSIADFTVTDGNAVDSEIIIHDQNLSLYCLDDENRRAIFVELSPSINLTTVPFVYTTQYEEAKRLIAVPYDEFCEIAKTLQPVEHLIMIYISGRSGSTLLSHIFNELDDVMSLSEPDVITQFIHLRAEDGSRDAELRELIDCTVRILFKPNPFKKPTTYALKYRMETLRAMDLFQATFPHAKNLYLYRDCVGFVASFYRILKKFDAPDYAPINERIEELSLILNDDLTPKKAYFEPDTEQTSIIQNFTIFWLTGIEYYLEQAAKGIPILAVRYRDFKTFREKVLRAIFEHCDLPVERASQPFKAFEHDSQAGSALARDNPQEGHKLQLTDEQHEEITRILDQHPVIKHSDFVVPNTLKV